MTALPDPSLTIDLHNPLAFDGHSFGATGPYSHIKGRMKLWADPNEPANAGIALLDCVPPDSNGMIAYESDVEILTPTDPSRGNACLFYDVLNRGTKRAVQRINTAPMSNTPDTPAALGNGFLMRQGFTLVWTGWQGDVPPGGGRMAAHLPAAGSENAPVTGPAREEFILDARAAAREDTITELAEGRFTYRLSYPRHGDVGSLTWRLHATDPRQTRDDVTWRWLSEREIEVTCPPDIDRGGLFEFIYTARDPIVMGLGLAAIRDSVSALRHLPAFADGTANPIFGATRRAIGFGLSQSGRVLRDFLHQGFNRDLVGRAVFDGLIPIIAGGRGAFLNRPFAQPGRFSRQHEDHDFPGDQFPFAYQEMTDPISGRRDGLLKRALADGVAPKIMHMDTDSEFWSARASLVVTDCEGNDAALPDLLRVYHAACVAHGDYDLASEIAAGPPNKLTYGPLIRAMVAAMLPWINGRVLPPASRYPTREAGTLVRPDEAAAAFPTMPGTRCPQVMNEVHLLDHNKVPPAAGRRYPAFVPQVDADGNSLGGVVHPLLAAPVATHTGWNLRQAGFAKGDFFNVFGASWPFPATDEPEDARKPLSERYPSLDDRVAQAKACLHSWVETGLLLPEDRDRALSLLLSGNDFAPNSL